MIMVQIIAAIAFLALILFIMHTLNKQSRKKIRYEFFSLNYALMFLLVHGLLVVGCGWYISELKTDGDILNGILMMCCGIAVFVGILIYNIKNTPRKYAVLFSFIQLVLFIPTSIVGVLVILTVIAATNRNNKN